MNSPSTVKKASPLVFIWQLRAKLYKAREHAHGWADRLTIDRLRDGTADVLASRQIGAGYMFWEQEAESPTLNLDTLVELDVEDVEDFRRMLDEFEATAEGWEVL